MSADFWAGYISGAVGILIGNPLDVLKVRLQAGSSNPAVRSSSNTISAAARQIATGTAAPVIGYGALNALLFVSYNRSEAFLNSALNVPPHTTNLWTTWLAGAVGGLATWVVSTPTELIKCRAQLASPPVSSLSIAKQTWWKEGIKGFYFGGVVTALRDSIGYGFYFWSYELSTRWLASAEKTKQEGQFSAEAAKVLLCGGLAGIVSWASIFPLDVIKTRVQTQRLESRAEGVPLLMGTQAQKRLGAIDVARETYREGGVKVFFRGLTVCSVRAFVVNAIQWAVYEWIMLELGQGRKKRSVTEAVAA